MYRSVRVRLAMLRGIPLSLIVWACAMCAPAWAQSLRLEWDPSVSPDVTGYNLYRSTTSGQSYARVNTSLISSTTFTDSTLHYDTTYYYVCTAVNQAGLESGYSNQVEARLAAPPPPNPDNNPPSAQQQTVTTMEDQAVTINVLTGAQDADGDPLSVVSVTQGARGSVQLMAAGGVRYSPWANVNGTDSFTYTISDGQGGTATATVRVSITPVNDGPIARDDTVVLQNRRPLEINVLGNDTDVDADPLTVLSVTQPVHGSAALGEGGSVTYTLTDTSFRGEDRFLYVLVDNAGGRDTGTVSVRVIGSNNPPRAVDDTVSLQEDTPREIDVLANDVDPDGDSLTVGLVEPPKSGTASIRGSRIIYTPDPDFFGSDSFTYSIRDSHGDISTATVSIRVLPVNDPPITHPDAGVTGPGIELRLAVLLNDDDPDGDPLQIRQFTQPLHGRVTAEADGTLSYLPKAGYHGADQFRYWASDGSADVPALVQLEVAEESAAHPLLFPASISDGAPPFDQVYVGLALLNAQDRFEQLQVRAFGGDGREVTPASRSSSLPPNGQEAFLTTELNDPKGEAQYLAATNFTQDLQGMVVVGDYDSRRMDGIGARPAAGRRLYIPEVVMSTTSQTFLQLINREARAGSIDLELYDGRSRRPARWSGTIEPSGSLRGLVSDYFGFTDGFQGFVKVVSDVDVSGIAVSAGPEWISTAPTMVSRSSRTWTAPHVFADRKGGDTFIRILNPGLLDSSGELTIYDDSGQTLSNRRLFIPAQQLTVMAASELFGGLLDIKGILSGSMVLTLDGSVPTPQVALVTYVTPRARTTVPLLGEGRTDATFPQVAHSKDGRIFTGLAIFNPSSATAHVTLEVYDAAGRRTHELELSLPPKAREAKMLGEPELFGPDFEQIRGHIRVRSDRPVFSYITFGDADEETLSALEPQPNSQ